MTGAGAPAAKAVMAPLAAMTATAAMKATATMAALVAKVVDEWQQQKLCNQRQQWQQKFQR